MIKNIIFDMGQVLIKFDPYTFMKRLDIYDPIDQSIIMKEIYKSVEWVKMDRGTLTPDEAVSIFEKRVPEDLKQYVNDLVNNWYKPLIHIPGMDDLLKSLKEKGYNLYLLSNADYNQTKYWPNVKGHEYFSDTLVSCFVKHIKPEKEIYETAINKFNIKPNESLFIDDNQLNVEAAINCGINGLVFSTLDNLKEDLRKWNIKF